MESISHTLAGVLSSHAPLRDALGDSAPRHQPARRKGPRRLEIEAQERAALSRAYAYRMQQAATHEELAALDREYQQRMAQGPAFTHYRSKSRFGEPPRHGLTRDDLAALRHRFNSMARQSWEQRAKRKHTGLFSRTCVSVFRTMLWLGERYDRLFPSLERIAHLAQCSRRSVVTALEVLERFGFLTRHRRLKIVEGLLGRKAEQDTNAYELHPPRAGRGALAWLLFAKPTSECKNRPATASVILSYLELHPETWGSPSIAKCNAYGGPPKAARS